MFLNVDLFIRGKDMDALDQYHETFNLDCTVRRCTFEEIRMLRVNRRGTVYHVLRSLANVEVCPRIEFQVEIRKIMYVCVCTWLYAAYKCGNTLQLYILSSFYIYLLLISINVFTLNLLHNSMH